MNLTPEEFDLILEALDSHRYWQLDKPYRKDGYVRDPGSDDPELAAKIVQVAALEDKLRLLRLALLKETK